MFNNAVDNFAQATVVAGTSKQPSMYRILCDCRKPGQQLQDGNVDMSLRSAYGIMGIGPKTPQEVASDYYQIDFVSIARLFTLNLAHPFSRNASYILLSALTIANSSPVVGCSCTGMLYVVDLESPFESSLVALANLMACFGIGKPRTDTSLVPSSLPIEQQFHIRPRIWRVFR